jgi:competence protein ComEA
VLAGTGTRAREGDALAWGSAGLFAAALVGVGAAMDDRLGVVLALSLTLAVGIVLRPKVILPILAASIFVEAVSVGGVPISRLVAPVALFVVLGIAMQRRLTVGATSPLVWVGAYFLWALASFSWTINSADTRFELGSLTLAVVYLLAVATLIESVRELRSVLVAIAAASLLVGLFGIATDALAISSQLQSGRPNGGAGDPNLFAVYQVLAIPPTIALAASTRRRWLRFLLVSAVLGILASIFVSESRGGLLALATVLLLIVVLPARAIFRSRPQKAAILISVVLASGVAFAVTGASLIERVGSLETSDPTGSSRVFLWDAAWTSIKQRPVLGLGYGAFPAAAPRLLHETQGVDFRHIELHATGKASETHNVYLGTLAELGLPGLVLFMSVLLATARQLIRTSKRAREAGAAFVARIANALLLSLLGWSVASIFLSTESSRSLWVLIGVSLALPKLIRRERPAGSRIVDAVARADGATRKAELALVNLGAPIADGTQIVVPPRAAPGAAVGGGAWSAPAGPVHLNTATLEDLEMLPGIGPVTAQKILDYRQQHGAFARVDELDAIPGIGPKRLDQLRDLVVP